MEPRCALAYYNSFNSWGWLDYLPPKTLSRVEVITGDIRDRGTVAKLMPGVDIVFHLAALIRISYSYQSPESYIGTNITGTFNILEEAKIHKPERLFGSKEKISQLTTWKQGFTLKQGLQETISWFSDPENLARYKVDIYNV